MDCSECGNTETLSRRIIEEEDEELEAEMIIKQELTNHSSVFAGRPIRDEEPVYQDNQIPIVGNLRRISRENQMMNNQSENSVRYNQPIRGEKMNNTMNIEKVKQKKGFIAEDEETKISVTPSVEQSHDNMSEQIKEKLNRGESFQKLQKRNQFRSVSPGHTDSKLEKYKKSGLLVQVEDGVPLIYKNNSPQAKSLDSPKSKDSSEMGDSGVGSHPASISPKSSSSGSSKDEHDTKDKSDEAATDDVIKAVVPPGGKKRDTMIRELKTKLKERFPSNTIESAKSINTTRHLSSSKPSSANTIRNPEVGPKLNKIFDNILSEKSQGTGILRTHYTNGSFSHEDDEDVDESLQQQSDEETEFESSVYDPSLPPGACIENI